MTLPILDELSVQKHEWDVVLPPVGAPGSHVSDDEAQRDLGAAGERGVGWHLVDEEALGCSRDK